MAWMMSRRFLRVFVVGLVLVSLFAMALAPWTGLLVEPDQSRKDNSQQGDTSHAVTQAEVQPEHSHEDDLHITGSPIASDNRRDIGYLRSNSRGERDRVILVCDYSSNGKKARARAFFGNVLVGQTYDVDGAGGYCWRDYTDGINAWYHDTCNWRFSGAGCGPNSRH